MILGYRAQQQATQAHWLGTTCPGNMESGVSDGQPSMVRCCPSWLVEQPFAWTISIDKLEETWIFCSSHKIFGSNQASRKGDANFKLIAECCNNTIPKKKYFSISPLSIIIGPFRHQGKNKTQLEVNPFFARAVKQQGGVIERVGKMADLIQPELRRNALNCATASLFNGFVIHGL